MRSLLTWTKTLWSRKVCWFPVLRRIQRRLCVQLTNVVEESRVVSVNARVRLDKQNIDIYGNLSHYGYYQGPVPWQHQPHSAMYARRIACRAYIVGSKYSNLSITTYREICSAKPPLPILSLRTQFPEVPLWLYCTQKMGKKRAIYMITPPKKRNQ